VIPSAKGYSSAEREDTFGDIERPDLARYSLVIHADMDLDSLPQLNHAIYRYDDSSCMCTLQARNVSIMTGQTNEAALWQ